MAEFTRLVDRRSCDVSGHQIAGRGNFEMNNGYTIAE
jgi:hypothetical protein